eukprot:TRINITY_DN3979_c0_g1_i1.p1 TRINITY_DN3979_c0_g1~~TRINITY_DN3979_c0_g1_i1.p1  ORF type:complete len:303 (+),score=24.43 TRINITY_DN3979_c0_g1_i1:41-910(+)
MAFLIVSLLLLSGTASALVDAVQQRSSSGDTTGEPRNIPTGGRVAVVLRGEPFRNPLNKQPCKSECRDHQLNASQTVVTQLIEPLETVWKNTVDVFNVACGEAPCGMTPDEELVLASTSQRKVRTTFVSSGSYFSGAQGACVQRALDFLDSESGDASQYDLIMLIRHDMEWVDSISSWSTADFAGFNFLSPCEEGALGESVPGKFYPCVNDVMQVFPGRLYKAWRAQVGTGVCFNTERANGWGHPCWAEAVNASGGVENVHFATPWVPERYVRDENAWSRFMYCDDRYR